MDVAIFFSLLFGTTEGLTEFIPVSSTAHILLLARYLELTQTSFFTTFTIAIQSGAILAALTYFWKTVWSHTSLIPKIAVAFLPTAIVGLLLHSVITRLFSQTALIGWMLIIGGIVFLFLRPIDTEGDLSSLSYKHAFLIGCAQILSFIPGVSRAGATLIGGTLLRIPRSHIVPFSFLLGIPTILGASVIGLTDTQSLSPFEWRYILIGTLTAGVIAYLTMDIFIKLLTKKPLAWFGWYRIALGIIALVFLS